MSPAIRALTLARVNALIAGDMHMITDVDAKMIKLIERSNNTYVNSTKSGRYGGICCLKNTAVFFKQQIPPYLPDFVELT